MPRQNAAILAFNRGEVSTRALARIDLDRLAFSAESLINWMPNELGSMSIRPGWQYIGGILSNNIARFLEFVFAADDIALIELTHLKMRVWIDDALIARPSGANSVIANGEFTSGLSSWTDADEAGATSSWVTGGHMGLLGTGTNAAIRRQLVTVSGSGIEHALNVTIARGPVTLRLGTTAGGSELMESALDTGVHSLAFTPSSDFYVEFASIDRHTVLVDTVSIGAAGTFDLTTPWEQSDLSSIRYQQSADIIFICCYGRRYKKIERRAPRSWSIVDYETKDGPFRPINITPIALSFSAITGDITVTASKPLFVSTQIGALFKAISAGQIVTETVSGADVWSDSIRVVGVDDARHFVVDIAGTWVGTVTLQRSSDDATWVEVKDWTSNDNETYDDKLDNQTWYYRIGIATGEYTSGSAILTLTYSGGSITGVIRLTAVASSTSASAVVLLDLGGTAATEDWYEGLWSDYRGYPSALSLYESRIFFAGIGKIVGSISASYYSFDADVAGDSGMIDRDIADGPIDRIEWLVPLSQLILGNLTSTKAAKSTSFEEPLTPTNFNLKNNSTQGSAPVDAAILDNGLIYVQKSGIKLHRLAWDQQFFDYVSTNLSLFNPEIGAPGIIAIGVQRQPDTRIHCVRSDGVVAIYMFDAAENVSCWVRVETDGFVEDVVILPDTEEDRVYYTVRRTIDGDTVRYLERWAKQSDTDGQPQARLADSFVYAAGPVTVVTDLGHLEGEEVVAWGNSKDLGTYTVSGAQITLSEQATGVTVGLGYTATYKSSKLAYGAQLGTALLQSKRISQIGLIAQNMHAQGIRYGKSLSSLYSLPKSPGHKPLNQQEVQETWDHMTFPFDGSWTTDDRVYLQATAPRPVTLLGVVCCVETNEKV